MKNIKLPKRQNACVTEGEVRIINVMFVYQITSMSGVGTTFYRVWQVANRQGLFKKRRNDRIVFAQKLGTFITKGTDDQARVVTLFPEKYSCGIKTCYHILAVKSLWAWT